MIDIRPFDSLGFANHGWLKARHHFSFANYHDPHRMTWGHIRVWNDDEIAPRSGFPPHPHADMEIITYVRSGAITHEDSLGNQGRTEAGDVQVMSAGTGVRHAEFNKDDVPTTLFQIWILTDKPGADPSWDTRRFPKADRSGQFEILASGDPGDDALAINADARVLGVTLKAGQRLVHKLTPERLAYLVPAVGDIELNGHVINARDGVAIKDETKLEIIAHSDAELVMVDTRPLDTPPTPPDRR